MATRGFLKLAKLYSLASLVGGQCVRALLHQNGSAEVGPPTTETELAFSLFVDSVDLPLTTIPPISKVTKDAIQSSSILERLEITASPVHPSPSNAPEISRRGRPKRKGSPESTGQSSGKRSKKSQASDPPKVAANNEESLDPQVIYGELPSGWAKGTRKIRDSNFAQKYEDSPGSIWYMVRTTCQKNGQSTEPHGSCEFFDLKAMPLLPVQYSNGTATDSNDDNQSVEIFAQSTAPYAVDHVFELWQLKAIIDFYRDDFRKYVNEFSTEADDELLKNLDLFSEDLLNGGNKSLTDSLKNILNDVNVNACGVDWRINALKRDLLTVDFKSRRLQKDVLSKDTWKKWYRTEAGATIAYLTNILPNYMHVIALLRSVINTRHEIRWGYRFESMATYDIYAAALAVFWALTDSKTKWKGESYALLGPSNGIKIKEQNSDAVMLSSAFFHAFVGNASSLTLAWLNTGKPAGGLGKALKRNFIREALEQGVPSRWLPQNAS